MGYADGYSRLLSNRGEVLNKGNRVPVIGRICKDQFMVDVSTQLPVAIGDEVVVFGRQNGSLLTVEELAAKIGTINYEVICMISERVPRIYHK
jgi:alanine racemase